jgi:hypothetical protein
MTASPTRVPGDPSVGALPLLGMVAYNELASFTRLAADAAQAPTLTDRLALARFAGLNLDGVDRIVGRIVEIGGDVEATMRPFEGMLTEFDRRTEPNTWWERLLKGYVGYGISDDVAFILADALDAADGDLVRAAHEDHGYIEYVVEALGTACREDPTLAARLALWGRRLVGEAFGVVQQLLGAHPEIDRALAEVAPGSDPDQKLFAQLTAEHTRRMGRLGLSA